MKNKKIAIIGNGTGGSVSAATCSTLLHKYPFEIDWYYDPSIKPQAVGEGTTLDVPDILRRSINFEWNDFAKIDGNYKHGIFKKNWKYMGNEYYHEFEAPNVSMHFNASKLQNVIMEKLSEKDKVNIFEENVSIESIDADYIIDCSGFPKTNDQLDVKETIPVNSVYVTQCYWDSPKFSHTDVIAMPFGWVWTIPLGNRCSVGYMYNNSLNSVEEIKENVKEVFDSLNLIPSEHTNSFSFRSFSRKTNFFENYCYNGNASFFLEPLEATSITTIVNNAMSAGAIVFGQRDVKSANSQYTKFIREIETMINLHYFASSEYDTDFWKKSKTVAEELIENRLQTDHRFRNFVKNGIEKKITVDDDVVYEYGTWTEHSWAVNIHGLGLQDKLKQML
jgi:hypothetical protein